MSLQIAPLREEHLEDAAALVSVRYKALREHVPLLPSRYEDVDTILPMLRDLTGEAPGVVAIRGSRLVGLLTGFVIPMFLGKRSVYSPEWANGAELGESRRVYEEMYGHLSAHWIANGCFTHLVSMLAHDREGIEGWQWLGFGLAAVDGVRELKPVEGAVAEVAVRRASVEDIEEAMAFDEALNQHLAAAPTFWMHEPQDYEEWLREPANALWLAYEGGEAVGCMGIGPGNPDACAIIRDEKTASIVSAFTQERARGRGIAKALLNRSLEWARVEGYERCAVDFEPMNFLAARFWLRCFEPVCYSLMRCIDGRIGWAHEGRESESFW
jgi:GNAT superfamily N-acetyltransferase